MSKHDEDLLQRGAVKEALKKLYTQVHYVGYIPVLCEAIDKLPAEKVLDKQLLQNRIRDYLKIRRGWISVTVEEFLADIFKEKKP